MKHLQKFSVQSENICVPPHFSYKEISVELNSHGTDDDLELYALGRLPESEVAVIEEHLIVCAACRDRLDRIEAFAMGMLQALEQAPTETKFAWREFVAGFMKKPAFALVLCGVAFVAVLTFAMKGRATSLPVASLQLMAIRGDMPSVAEARELDLTFADAPSTGGPFRIEVVDATGSPKWSVLASPADGGLSVKIPRQLAPGNYFVRLRGAGDQVLHEYGFRVRN